MNTFDELQTTLDRQGIEAVLENLAAHLAAEKKYHDLFDVRLMQARHRHGLPVILTTGLDELAEDLRTRMEEAYLGACREIGQRLLEDGNVREAWMYLRPVGDKAPVAAALEKLPAEENYETIIEIALHEGVCPRLGFQMVLDHYGVCNAITMFDSEMQNKPRKDKQEVAALLVRRLHADLSASLRSDIERQKGSPAKEQTIAELVRDRDWLFAGDNYHIDTTHLAAVVRFALVLEDPQPLKLAVDLTEYGRRLSPSFQFKGEPPFEDAYPASALFFKASLGEAVEEALAYFRQQAEGQSVEEGGSGPAEVYISLLARVGRHEDAIEAAHKLLPPGTRTSGFAPSMLELARRGNVYQRLKEVCRLRGDLVSFAAGLVEEKLRG